MLLTAATVVMVLLLLLLQLLLITLFNSLLTGATAARSADEARRDSFKSLRQPGREQS